MHITEAAQMVDDRKSIPIKNRKVLMLTMKAFRISPNKINLEAGEFTKVTGGYVARVKFKGTGLVQSEIQMLAKANPRWIEMKDGYLEIGF